MAARKTYMLRNLSCADCAAKIERGVGALEGVESAVVDYPAKRLHLAFKGDLSEEAVLDAALKLARTIEPEIEFAQTPERKDENAVSKGTYARLGAGLALFAAAIILEILGICLPFRMAACLAAYLAAGMPVLLKAARSIRRGKVFNENSLMAVATLGALGVGKFEEAAAVMLFYKVGELLEETAAARSVRSVEKLMDIRPDYAGRITDKGVERLSPEEVKVGDLIEIRPGEKVPLDGRVVSGASYADTAAMTGEPQPRAVAPGDEILAGFINLSGRLTVEVLRPFGESSAARVLKLMRQAGERKAATERFITRFAEYYTPAVTLAALLTAVLPPLLFAQPFRVWFYRALTFLVVSCPCAMVISIPLSFFAGMGAASRAGVLVKGGAALERLARLKMVAFDKTGTLTCGVFQVADILPAPGVAKERLLETAALAESLSTHPIAAAIRKAAGQSKAARPEQYAETPGLGVSAEYGGRRILAGGSRLMAENGIATGMAPREGTAVHVAENGAYLGCILLLDAVRPDAALAVSRLRALKIERLVMFTGDNAFEAQAAAAKIGIERVHAGLLPEQKAELFESYRPPAGTAAFVGDGVNDAPVLALADVGIAMGGLGSDAAVEAADAVVMNDEVSKIASAVRIARFTLRLARQNIVFALAAKLAMLVFAAAGFADMWWAVFADVGVALLAILNAMRVQFKKSWESA